MSNPLIKDHGGDKSAMLRGVAAVQQRHPGLAVGRARRQELRPVHHSGTVRNSSITVNSERLRI